MGGVFFKEFILKFKNISKFADTFKLKTLLKIYKKFIMI